MSDLLLPVLVAGLPLGLGGWATLALHRWIRTDGYGVRPAPRHADQAPTGYASHTAARLPDRPYATLR